MMAKGGAPIEIMPAAELKPLLHLSKRQPVCCAIGMTRDKQGVVLVHKRTRPRKLLAELLRQAKAAGADLDRATMRFGRATVDGASDSSTVHFTVNKAAADALRVKLLERLRPVGFQHCDVTVDAELENEPEDGTDEADGPAAPKPHGGAPDPDAGTPAPGRDTGEAAPAPPVRAEAPPEGTVGPDAPPPALGQAGPDVTSGPTADPDTAAATADQEPAAVRDRLTALARRAAATIAADPSRADTIRAAAAQARQALASGAMAAAGQAADTLEGLLPPEGAGGVSGQAADARSGGPAAASTRHPPGSPVFAKGQAAWTAVRTKLQTDIDAAMKGMAAFYGEDDRRVRAILNRVEPIMKQLDDSLAVKLGEVAGNTAPGAHAGLVKEAEGIIGRYRAFVDGEPMIAGLDTNPFHPMAVRRTMDTALSALSKVVETVA